MKDFRDRGRLIG